MPNKPGVSKQRAKCGPRELGMWPRLVWYGSRSWAWTSHAQEFLGDAMFGIAPVAANVGSPKQVPHAWI